MKIKLVCVLSWMMLGCASSVERPDEITEIEPRINIADPDGITLERFRPHSNETVPQVDNLAQCLLDGGTLSVTGSFSNNDQVEHGEVQSMAVSASGVAIATDDQAIKFWNFEGNLDFKVDPTTLGAFSYGPEQLTESVKKALVFRSGELIAGDNRGLVESFNDQGDRTGFVGGTTGEAIVAMSVSVEGDLAFIDSEAGGGLQLILVDGTRVGPLLAMHDSRDLVFLDDSLLVVGGDDEGRAAWVRVNFAGEVVERGRSEHTDPVLTDVVATSEHVFAVSDGGSAWSWRRTPQGLEEPLRIWGVQVSNMTAVGREVVVASGGDAIRAFDSMLSTLSILWLPDTYLVERVGDKLVSVTREGAISVIECGVSD